MLAKVVLAALLALIAVPSTAATIMNVNPRSEYEELKRNYVKKIPVRLDREIGLYWFRGGAVWNFSIRVVAQYSSLISRNIDLEHGPQPTAERIDGLPPVGTNRNRRVVSEFTAWGLDQVWPWNDGSPRIDWGYEFPGFTLSNYVEPEEPAPGMSPLGTGGFNLEGDELNHRCGFIIDFCDLIDPTLYVPHDGSGLLAPLFYPSWDGGGPYWQPIGDWQVVDVLIFERVGRPGEYASILLEGYGRVERAYVSMIPVPASGLLYLSVVAAAVGALVLPASRPKRSLANPGGGARPA